MDCKPELSTTMSKKSTNHLVHFQINTHTPHKKIRWFQQIPCPLHCELVKYTSINQNWDQQQKCRKNKFKRTTLYLENLLNIGQLPALRTSECTINVVLCLLYCSLHFPLPYTLKHCMLNQCRGIRTSPNKSTLAWSVLQHVLTCHIQIAWVGSQHIPLIMISVHIQRNSTSGHTDSRIYGADGLSKQLCHSQWLLA